MLDSVFIDISLVPVKAGTLMQYFAIYVFHVLYVYSHDAHYVKGKRIVPGKEFRENAALIKPEGGIKKGYARRT